MPTYQYQIAGHDNASITAKHYHDISISTLNELAKNNIPSNAIVSSVQIHFRASISSGDTKFYVGWTNDGSKQPGSSFISGQLTTTPTSYYYNITSFSSTYPFNISSSYSKIGFYASSGIIIKGYMCSDFRITYTYSIPTYTATFLNWDGTLLYSATVESGKTPSYSGAAPTRDRNAQYDYSFSGWNPTVGAIYSDTTYTAQFTQTLRQYTINVTCDQSEAGERCTVSGSGTYKYGDTITLQATNIPKHHKFNSWMCKSPPQNFYSNPHSIVLDENFLSGDFEEISIVCYLEHTGFIVKATVVPDNAGIVKSGTYYTFDGEEKYFDYGQGIMTSEGWLVEYWERSRVAVNAVENEGYEFVKWSDGDTTNPRRLNLTDDATYTAVFRINRIIGDENFAKKILCDLDEVKAVLIDKTKLYG